MADFQNAESKKALRYNWELYNGKLSDKASQFNTSAQALVSTALATENRNSNSNSGTNQTVFGDEGETLIYEYEKNRVAAFSARLVNKVKAVGRMRGLGYDIQSVVAQLGDDAEFYKYIEVKSTRRVTSPSLESSTWFDTLNLTRNEWIAAQQHGKYYSIYRVYFTRNGIIVFVVDNVKEKSDSGKLHVVPTNYRVDLSYDSIDSVFNLE